MTSAGGACLYITEVRVPQCPLLEKEIIAALPGSGGSMLYGGIKVDASWSSVWQLTTWMFTTDMCILIDTSPGFTAVTKNVAVPSVLCCADPWMTPTFSSSPNPLGKLGDTANTIPAASNSMGGHNLMDCPTLMTALLGVYAKKVCRRL